MGEEPVVTAPEGEEGGEIPVAVASPMSERMAVVAGMPGPPPRGRPSCIPQPVPNLARIPDPPRMREVSVISPNALPDFRPPFATGALRADMDGNLWVQTNPARPTRGGPVYDIISRDEGGRLMDRIQVPIGYTLVGFGRDRVVYVATRDAQGVHLARVRLK